MAFVDGAMSSFMAYRNVRQQPARTAATLASTGFAILLVFMQLGFSQTARRAHTLLFEMLDFDLMVTSDRFESLKNVRDFPASRLYQVRAVPGVAAASGLNVEWARWLDPDTETASSCMVVGLDLDSAFVRDPVARRQLEALRRGNCVLVDTLSHPDYGPVIRGRTVRLNAVNVTIAGVFRLGTDFKADGRAWMSNTTFRAVVHQEADRLSMGMVKLQPGAPVGAVRDALTRALPPDVLVFDRETFVRQEQDYYTQVKPIGLFFQAGVVVAFCVGAVILFQVLATDIATRFAEFATMKAIGLTHRFIYAIGFQQALIYGVCSYLPALLLASAIFASVARATRLPIGMDLPLAALVFVLSIAMCAVSSLLALRRVRKADPADLF